jgi:hypothetical protein
MRGGSARERFGNDHRAHAAPDPRTCSATHFRVRCSNAAPAPLRVGVGLAPARVGALGTAHRAVARLAAPPGWRVTALFGATAPSRRSSCRRRLGPAGTRRGCRSRAGSRCSPCSAQARQRLHRARPARRGRARSRIRALLRSACPGAGRPASALACSRRVGAWLAKTPGSARSETGAVRRPPAGRPQARVVARAASRRRA